MSVVAGCMRKRVLCDSHGSADGSLVEPCPRGSPGETFAYERPNSKETICSLTATRTRVTVGMSLLPLVDLMPQAQDSSTQKYLRCTVAVWIASIPIDGKFWNTAAPGRCFERSSKLSKDDFINILTCISL